MSRIQTTKGACAFCGQVAARGSMSKHLATCTERQARLEKAAAIKSRKLQPLYTLAMRDKEFTAFWLHLEVNGSAPLAELDRYLRVIWVDCCDHRSFFTIAGTEYKDLIDDKFTLRGEKSLSTPVGEAFQLGKPGAYEYDFAAPSKLVIEVVSVREGKPLSQHPVTLLARNVMPAFKCAECGQPAGWLCVQCYYERGEEKCYLCAEHVNGHACTLYGGPRKVVNSPRLGRCKYNGPAKPPY